MGTAIRRLLKDKRPPGGVTNREDVITQFLDTPTDLLSVFYGQLNLPYTFRRTALCIRYIPKGVADYISLIHDGASSCVACFRFRAHAAWPRKDRTFVFSLIRSVVVLNVYYRVLIAL